MRTLLPLVVLIFAAIASWHSAFAEIPPIKRVLPPEGLEIPADVRERLETRLAAARKRMEPHKEHALLPDVEIFTKAVELALLHREFYVPKDFAKADWALDEANKRLDSLDMNESPWETTTGLVVRGYGSGIDGSVQPYGLVIPKEHDFSKPCPLYVWLHGRGDKNTDLHFLHERATKAGQISPPGAIVLHPFGRHCVGYKHAGEIDVLDATQQAFALYSRDPNRIVLIGFSMGGAGAWHIGAHYPGAWTVVAPGAGFAETARYQRLTPDKYPPEYEQKLWGLYDVPGYVRNLFNTRVVAYSGELDKQIQAARVMEEAYKTEGRELEHLIGPGVEHKYEPQTLERLLATLDATLKEADKHKDVVPSEVSFQTRTLAYWRLQWVQVMGLDEHWVDSRIDARRDDRRVNVNTRNISRFLLEIEGDADRLHYTIDGRDVSLPAADQRPGKSGNFNYLHFAKSKGRWEGLTVESLRDRRVRKIPGIQGPIDDAFRRRFVVVLPSKKSKNPRFQEWMEFELSHLQSRWRALMRAELPVRRDTDGWDNGSAGLNYILLGDPDSNSLLAQVIDETPLRFSEGKWNFSGQTYDGDKYVPTMIYPYKDGRGRLNGYFVLNSGLTFREGHDRTNSQQNPKLPDWAIIDITQSPDAFSPGRIHDAGFFDEEWKLKGPVKGP